MATVTAQQLVNTLRVPEDASEILAAVVSRAERLTTQEQASLSAAGVVATEYGGKVVFGTRTSTTRNIVRKSDGFYNKGGMDFGWRPFP